MGNLRIVIIIAAAIGLAASLVWSFLTRMPGAARGRARKLLSSASWLGADSKDGDLVKLTGVVRAREAGERLMSPISNIRCVALRIRAQPRRGLDPRAKLVEKIDFKPFDLEDPDGRVPIEPTSVLFDISPLAQSKPDASGRANVLTELGHPSANSAKSNIEETVVEIGATVTIAGTLATVDGTQRLVGDIACAVDRRLDRAHAP
ncbi:MAG: hypothetical protein JNL83_37540 [Myxococcales bacterium]|nr:hypothetical protein [Myxococcales bacterium]